jgi:hypothetical protein
VRSRPAKGPVASTKTLDGTTVRCLGSRSE